MSQELSNGELQTLADAYVEGFIRTIHRLITGKEQAHDLLIGAGNSGIVMAKLASLVYEQCSLPTPPILRIPIVRGQDNDGLLPCVESQLLHVPRIANVLFVDDEIGPGTTVQTALRLILASHSNTSDLASDVVAEDREPGRVLQNENAKITLHSYPGTYTPWPCNIILNCFKPAMLEPIRSFIPNENDKARTLNIALKLPIKKFEPGKPPYFSDELNIAVEAGLPGLTEARSKLVDYLRALISRSTQHS